MNGLHLLPKRACYRLRADHRPGNRRRRPTSERAEPKGTHEKKNMHIYI